MQAGPGQPLNTVRQHGVAHADLGQLVCRQLVHAHSRNAQRGGPAAEDRLVRNARLLRCAGRKPCVKGVRDWDEEVWCAGMM